MDKKSKAKLNHSSGLPKLIQAHLVWVDSRKFEIMIITLAGSNTSFISNLRFCGSFAKCHRPVDIFHKCTESHDIVIVANG